MTRGTAQQARLRVGLVLNDLELPAWQCAVVRKIRASHSADIALVVTLAPARPGVVPGEAGTPADGGWLRSLAEAANNAIEGRVKLEAPALAIVDAGSLLADIPSVQACFDTRDQCWKVAEGPARPGAPHIDVLVQFSNAGSEIRGLPAATYGVWTVRHGDAQLRSGNPPGFWEVFTGTPLVMSSLCVATSPGQERVVDCMFSATDQTSVSRNNNKVFWQSASLIPRYLRKLHRGGPKSFAAMLEQAAPCAAQQRGPPTTGELAAHVAKLCWRGLRNQVHDGLYLDQWMLLFRFGEPSCYELPRFRRMIPPKDRYWADPIAVFRDGKYYIFVEEVPFATDKGHISVIVMDRNGNYDASAVVLDRTYHLSYPFVFQYSGETYMVPESLSNRTIELYRCVDFPWRWEHAHNLIEDIAAVDSTLIEHEGKWWLFANVVENPGGSTWNELHLFHADSPVARAWTPHPGNPIVSDVRHARPAGPLFASAGKLYRPGQDSSARYGYGIRIHEVTRLDENEYAETEVAAIAPDAAQGIIATHTLTHAGELTVVDALQPRLKL